MKTKGISSIIATVIMVSLVLVLVGILWGVISGIVNENVESSEACFNLYGKMEIGNDFTCYNSTSKELQFSILVGDLNPDKILVSLENSEGKKTISLSKEEKVIENVWKKGAEKDSPINIPEANSGKTYIVNVNASNGLNLENPTKISIAPRMGKTLCEVSDVLDKIDYCAYLLN